MSKKMVLMDYIEDVISWIFMICFAIAINLGTKDVYFPILEFMIVPLIIQIMVIVVHKKNMIISNTRYIISSLCFSIWLIVAIISQASFEAITFNAGSLMFLIPTLAILLLMWSKNIRVYQRKELIVRKKIRLNSYIEDIVVFFVTVTFLLIVLAVNHSSFQFPVLFIIPIVLQIVNLITKRNDRVLSNIQYLIIFLCFFLWFIGTFSSHEQYWQSLLGSISKWTLLIPSFVTLALMVLKNLRIYRKSEMTNEN